ncbi:hypothetical protein, partial [Lactobacillus sp.]|uniref:hypothetical protein n=1 Tax=Lactobacillus sp. TaxID=1591 RepID=UPI003F0FAE01
RQICFFIRFMIGAPGGVVVTHLSLPVAINRISCIFSFFNRRLFLICLFFSGKAGKISAIFSKKLGKRKMAT